MGEQVIGEVADVGRGDPKPGLDWKLWLSWQAAPAGRGGKGMLLNMWKSYLQSPWLCPCRRCGRSPEGAWAAPWSCSGLQGVFHIVSFPLWGLGAVPWYLCVFQGDGG